MKSFYLSLFTSLLVACSGGGGDTPAARPSECIAVAQWTLEYDQPLDYGTIYVAQVPMSVTAWAVEHRVDPYSLIYVFPDGSLPGGVMWFSMTVTNENGESDFSNEVRKECK